MFWETFQTEQGLSLSLYSQLFESKLWQSFLNSLALALLVALLTTIIGTFLGVIISKTSLPFSNFFLIFFLTPLLIPPYIFAFSWFEIIGREGILGELLFSFWGTVFILFWVYLPIPMLLSRLFLSQIDPKLEESALLLCSWRDVLRSITLPIIFPAILFSFLLVFILTFGEFSVANFLRYPIFPMESFTQFSAFYDFKMATVTAMPMLLMALAIKWLIDKSTFGYRFKTTQKIKKIALNRYKFPILLLLIIFALFVISPLTLLIAHSDIDSFFIALERSFEPLMRSLIYASMGATLLTLFGFLGGYIIEKNYTALDGILLFLFITPATVIGIGLTLFWNNSWSNWLYGTPHMILLGYGTTYLFLTTKIAQIRLSQIPKSMVESAQLTGATWSRIVWSILLPLSRKSLVAMWLIGFIFALRETTITMLVYPAGSDTLPLYIFTQMANGEPKVIASLCLIMVGVVLIPLGIYLLWRKK
jgi:iron(III) transport system permease protein